MKFRALPLVIGSVAALAMMAGCAMTVSEPSLAPRAVEHLTAAEPASVAPPPTVIPEDAPRQERATALLARAREGDAQFRERLTNAQSLVASGSNAAIGSEAWVQAEQEVSRADALRQAAVQSLADLDALQIDAVQSGIGTETANFLASTIEEVSAIDANEREAIQSLRDRLSAP